jgi:hypothetical protein
MTRKVAKIMKIETNVKTYLKEDTCTEKVFGSNVYTVKLVFQ